MYLSKKATELLEKNEIARAIVEEILALEKPVARYGPVIIDDNLEYRFIPLGMPFKLYGLKQRVLDEEVNLVILEMKLAGLLEVFTNEDLRTSYALAPEIIPTTKYPDKENYKFKRDRKFRALVTKHLIYRDTDSETKKILDSYFGREVIIEDVKGVLLVEKGAYSFIHRYDEVIRVNRIQIGGLKTSQEINELKINYKLTWRNYYDLPETRNGKKNEEYSSLNEILLSVSL